MASSCSATLFAAGETLRLIVQGRDIYDPGLPGLPFACHVDLRNAGRHVIHCAGSWLLVPTRVATGGGSNRAGRRLR